MKQKRSKKKLICSRMKQIRPNMEKAILMTKSWEREEEKQVRNYRQIIYKIKAFLNSKRYWMICKLKFNYKWRILLLNIILKHSKTNRKTLKRDIQSSINLKSKIFIIKNTSQITKVILNQNRKAIMFNFNMSLIQNKQEIGWIRKWRWKFSYRKNRRDLLLFQVNLKVISIFLKQNQTI